MIRVNVEIIDHRRSNVIRMSMEEYRDFISIQGELLGMRKEDHSSELQELESMKKIKGFIGLDLGCIACGLCSKSDEENESIGGIKNDK